MNELITINSNVFKYREGGGNPCPIVLPDNELTTQEMQSISAKFNLETVFIYKEPKKDNQYTFRYFVPNYEMDMCIHAKYNIFM